MLANKIIQEKKRRFFLMKASRSYAMAQAKRDEEAIQKEERQEKELKEAIDKRRQQIKEQTKPTQLQRPNPQNRLARMSIAMANHINRQKAESRDHKPAKKNKSPFVK